MSTRMRIERGFVAKLRRDPAVKAIENDHAAEAHQVAKALAKDHEDTGAYGRSLTVKGSRLYTDDPGGHVIEYGSSKQAPQAILRRAAESIGCPVVDGGP